jgi:alpha-glucuronidase
MFFAFGALVVWYELKQMHLKKIIFYQHELLKDVKEHIKEKDLGWISRLVELEKLKHQKGLLDSAYKKGFIGKETLDSSKRAIEDLINELQGNKEKKKEDKWDAEKERWRKIKKSL